MNRFKVTYDTGQSLLLYKQSANEIPTQDYIGTVVSITPYTDTTYTQYIEIIKQKAEFLGYDYRGRECYKGKYYKGYLIIKLCKDTADNSYYDVVYYQEHTNGQYIVPTLFTLSTSKEVCKLLSIEEPHYTVYSHRYYGQPKLSKPKALKGIKPIGSATFIQGHCSPQIFIENNNIWIKHTDYFSNSWRPPEGERIDMPISYYLQKYFNKSKTEKFIYADCWSSIVLRNEAWIILENYIPVLKTSSRTAFTHSIIKEQRKDKYTQFRTADIEGIWSRFWEDMYRVVKERITDTTSIQG